MTNRRSITIGTVKLGVPDYGFSSKLSQEKSDPIDFLKTAELAGICHFDTSPRYGHSEDVLGRYIAQSKSEISVSSKIDNLSPGDPDSPQKMLASVKVSLSKLNLSRLDICYLHQNELDIITDCHIHKGLSLLKENELISYTGASLYSPEECEYAIESGQFDFLQVPVSVFDVTFYDRFIRNNKSPVRFAARSLFLQGILVNRDEISKNIRQHKEVFEYLAELDEIAEECGVSTLELALGFVFSLKGIDRYLLGTSSPDNLMKNLQCIENTLPSQVFDRVLEMAGRPKNWANPRNWS